MVRSQIEFQAPGECADEREREREFIEDWNIIFDNCYMDGVVHLYATHVSIHQRLLW